jgi:hypothetical protein
VVIAGGETDYWMRSLLDAVSTKPKGTMVDEARGGSQEQAAYQMAVLDAHGL